MKKISNDFFISIEKVMLAHEFVLTEANKCDYSDGRNISGISYALSGEARYILKNGKCYTARAGDIIFLPSGVKYTVEIRGEYRHFTANFLINKDGSSDILPNDDLMIQKGNDESFFYDEFLKLCKIWSAKALGYEMKAIMYVYRIMESFIERGALISIGENKSYKRILPAKEYIEKNYAKELSVKALSSLCGMSQTNFRRLFSSLFSKTYIQYRDELRILKAKDYLSGGFYSVTETAYACGFTDVSYFCRFFKKHTGVTPLGFCETV